MLNLHYQIIRHLRKVEGISAHELAKRLKKYPSNIVYHLKEFLEDGIVKKKGPKYYLIKTTFLYKGTVIAHSPSDDSFLFFGCPYGESCNCQKETIGTCKLLQELPKEIQELVNGS